MKVLLGIFVFFGFLPNVFAWGYQRGNGGNVVLCDGETEGHFLDLFLFARFAPTSRIQYEIKSDDQTTHGSVKTLIAVIEKYDSRRAQLYRQWLNSFFAEAQAIPDMPDRVIRDQGLLTPIQLLECSIHQLVVQWQSPKDKFRYWVSKPLWQSLANPSRAAAIFHELVLREPLSVAVSDIKTRSVSLVVAAVLGIYYYKGTEYQKKYEANLKEALKDLDKQIAQQQKRSKS